MPAVRYSEGLSLMMILQDMSFGEKPKIRDKKTEMAKLEENVNFQMYFKDYWNIRWAKKNIFFKVLDYLCH